MNNIENYFNKTKDMMVCNTSYPLNKELWQDYKNKYIDLFDKTIDKLSLYIHVPFCNNLCKFCEYTRFKKRNTDDERNYINLLEDQVSNFINTHDIKLLYGLDIGGGTPTCLDEDNFSKLMDIVKKINRDIRKIYDYESSIEGSFSSMTETKIKLLANAGFKRMSFGLQTINFNLLKNNDRETNSINQIQKVFELLKKYGIIKINLDLMYGLKDQNKEDLFKTIKAIKILNPEQVTLYETRYNMLDYKIKIDKNELYEQYSDLYNGLTSIGYISRFGQNTFSKFNDDGMSSYLRYRVKEFIPYKGFGISAQSLSNIGISYNVGKNNRNYENCLQNNFLYEDDIYKLTSEELLAKYIAISFYYGMFDLNIMNRILNKDPKQYFKTEFDYLLKNKYIKIQRNLCFVTNEGFKYYGAIVSLFYSKKHKQYINEVI